MINMMNKIQKEVKVKRKNQIAADNLFLKYKLLPIYIQFCIRSKIQVFGSFFSFF
jgi:sorbitol-specific phosphotransferase system component IIC